MYYLANANNSLHDEQTEISMEKYQMNGSKRVITVFPLPEKKKETFIKSDLPSEY